MFDSGAPSGVGYIYLFATAVRLRFVQTATLGGLRAYNAVPAPQAASSLERNDCATLLAAVYGMLGRRARRRRAAAASD